jgi:hypothetical protein
VKSEKRKVESEKWKVKNGKSEKWKKWKVEKVKNGKSGKSELLVIL